MNVQPPQYKSLKDKQIYSSGSTLNIRRQLFALGALLRDSRYDFLFRPGPWCPSPDFDNLDAQPEEDIDALMASWLGSEHPVTILDLSGVPTNIQSDLIGALLRILFDTLFWGRHLPQGGRQRPLLIVLEEAHAYLGVTSNGAAAGSARRLVKEGRKYGIGVMVVSQRPSEIDSGILSQCGTLFAMRLANSTDCAHVAAAVSDNLEGLLDMLPTLRTGEAIVVGQSVSLPMRTIIDAPSADRRPESDDPAVYDPQGTQGWNAPQRSGGYGKIVRTWRSEHPMDSSQEEECDG